MDDEYDLVPVSHDPFPDPDPWAIREYLRSTNAAVDPGGAGGGSFSGYDANGMLKGQAGYFRPADVTDETYDEGRNALLKNKVDISAETSAPDLGAAVRSLLRSWGAA